MNDRKVIILGIDGMDPKLCKRFLDEGKLPNIQKILSVGAAREDLMMLGGVPTITPPMWTTLSTGAYPMTHGITCYFNTLGNELGRLENNFDSTKVKAEQLWEVSAKAGKKTLVWTWPCSWPPAIDNPNLHVVGGMAPTGPNAGYGTAEGEHLIYASEDYSQVKLMVQEELHGGAGCIITDDMKEAMNKNEDDPKMPTPGECNGGVNIDAWPSFNTMEGEELIEFELALTRYESPIHEPKNWKFDIPEGAKEFTVVVSHGLIQYPALILKNADGKYDTVAVYKNKKDSEPIDVIKDGEFHPTVVSDIIKDDQRIAVTRHFSIVKIDPEGKSLAFSVGDALDITTDGKTETWAPKSLYQQTVDIAGYIPHTGQMAADYPELISRRILPGWDNFQKWQAKALLGLIEENDYEVIFTHNHSCDHLGHAMWRRAMSREKYGWNDEKVYQGFIEDMYNQVDDYIGEFLPLIDKGWDIIVTSDHGLLCAAEDELPLMGDAFAMNIGVMRDLGYTVMQKDENGNDTRRIDWEKTKAVAPRGNHIYINLKGRNPKGSVDPADKYDLERQIIDDLYSYRMDGKRIVQFALRNKDAKLIGLGGEECGDIIYFLDEGFNHLHGDASSTIEGYFDTSVSPIFFAAGPGIKKGIKTERMIREVDVAPTVATLLDLDMPAQCEGAPVYQILEK